MCTDGACTASGFLGLGQTFLIDVSQTRVLWQFGGWVLLQQDHSHDRLESNHAQLYACTTVLNIFLQVRLWHLTSLALLCSGCQLYYSAAAAATEKVYVTGVCWPVLCPGLVLAASCWRCCSLVSRQHVPVYYCEGELSFSVVLGVGGDGCQLLWWQSSRVYLKQGFVMIWGAVRLLWVLFCNQKVLSHHFGATKADRYAECFVLDACYGLDASHVARARSAIVAS
jgi:hypothetical protein